MHPPCRADRCPFGDGVLPFGSRCGAPHSFFCCGGCTAATFCSSDCAWRHWACGGHAGTCSGQTWLDAGKAAADAPDTLREGLCGSGNGGATRLDGVVSARGIFENLLELAALGRFPKACVEKHSTLLAKQFRVRELADLARLAAQVRPVESATQVRRRLGRFGGWSTFFVLFFWLVGGGGGCISCLTFRGMGACSTLATTM